MKDFRMFHWNISLSANLLILKSDVPIIFFQYIHSLQCILDFTGHTSELSIKNNYRILILGASETGKTSIIRQFLYDQFTPRHKETMDDMYRGEFEDLHGSIYLEIFFMNIMLI